MALSIIDIINSMFQAVLCGYSITYCAEGKTRTTNFKLIVMCILFTILNVGFTSLIGNLSICVFLIHIFSLGIVSIIYKNEKLKSVIAYTLISCLISTFVIVVVILFLGFINSMILIQNVYAINSVITSCTSIIFILLCLKNMSGISQIYNMIISEKQSTIVLIMTSFVLDFVVAFYLMLYQNETILLKNIMTISLCIFLVGILVYFVRIKKKADEIFKLNEVLATKNSELRKIKNKHIAEVSYLYGLHCMNKWDELGKILKGIINNSSNISNDRDDIENCRNSMLALCLRQARDRGIRIILEDNCDISSVDMKEIELYRVISNIINNAIKAMNGSGIIIVKTYYELENVVIKIENNGPKIPNANINDIFKAGFTTKKNIDSSHGYGLSIVKELVEACSGKIAVKSTDISTEFKIILPLKKL